MSNTNNNTPTPNAINPLQTNNTLIAIVAYAAGAAAQKLPIFDVATWNYIFMSILGLVFVGWTGFANRKTAVVATVAQMPEVNKIELDKNVAGATELAQATPAEVVAK